MQIHIDFLGVAFSDEMGRVTIRGCHLLQSLRSFHKWYPRLLKGQPSAERSDASPPPVPLSPLADARFDSGTGGYTEISLRLM